MKHQGNDTDSPSDDPLLPEVYAATVACIYNVDGKCKGTLTPERLNIIKGLLTRQITAAYMTTSTHSPMNLASELVGLVTRKHNIQAKR
jgi:hypothetical protein